jgi:hypothetical protein
MTDDEIEAARTAPLSAPNEELKQHIVNRTRAALSDANQGQRVCAVCNECVFKNESRLGPFCQSVERSLQQRCSAARQQPPLDVTLISQCDCSNVHRDFEGVLLSRKAFETARCEVERANTSGPTCRACAASRAIAPPYTTCQCRSATLARRR